MVSSTVSSKASAALGVKGVEVVGPDDEKYSELIKRWSDASEQKAGAIVLPTTAEQISEAVKFARQHNVEFVAAGGRHSVSSASSTTGGLVIDLRNMRSVVVDEAAKTLAVQGGATWADVDTEAAKFGLCTVGGTVNHTGVGGLTLGGGFGFLSGRYGLTIDNLLSVTMVLADGSITTCSSTENTDLFWAVRGAGACFGIASSFTFVAHPIPKEVFAGMVVFTPDKLSQLIAFVNSFAQRASKDEVLNLGFSRAPEAGFAPVILAAPIFFGSEADGRAYFADLLAIGPIVEHLQSVPYVALNGMMNNAVQFGGRRAMGGASFSCPLDAAKVQTAFDEYVRFTADNGINDAIFLWELFPHQKILEVPVGDMAFPNRGEYYNIGMLMKWEDPSLDTKCRDWLRERGRTLRTELGSSETKGAGVYSNYVTADTKSSRLFAGNQNRLVELKKRYDPDNCFKGWHNLMDLPLLPGDYAGDM